MAILKKEYELSVWDETLGEKGQKEEVKRAIIGAHDMSYDGRATALKLSRKINGTNVLTFQMPSKYFDSKLGEYIHNEFCDYIFNERKLKLKYDGEWFEFYVKSINENKQFKSIMYQYQCEDAFIDELSRNGYGITFDTELYNNVEEIGVFTEQILEDSIWQYDASKNWGDFTEYAEEKLFKVPVSMFDKIVGYKINYDVSNTEEKENILNNPFSGETRKLEMGDDLSRQKKIFWDNGKFDKGISLLNNKSENIANDGYIYIPYSCLDFCYVSNDKDGKGFAATEEPVIGTIGGVNSYYLTPKSIDPTSLIQFIAIPSGAELFVDEAGLLVNKDYSYVMTLADWNENVNTEVFYNSENKTLENGIVSNKVVGYKGYLEKIGDTDVSFGKKISITDRTEINISKDIDQYVTVYNNSQEDYLKNEMFSSTDWKEDNIDYRICSYEATRMIVPQLARNLVQNGTEMTDTSGWEIMKSLITVGSVSSSISVRPAEETTNENITEESTGKPGGLLLNANISVLNEEDKIDEKEAKLYRTFINFGIVGQEEEISREQTYVFKLNGDFVLAKEQKDESGETSVIYTPTTSNSIYKVIIGEGGYDSEGDYTISEDIVITNIDVEKNYFIRPDCNIKNPYIAIQFDTWRVPDNIDEKTTLYYNLKELTLAKAYTKGIDFFADPENKGKYKYTGRDIFFNLKEWVSTQGGYWRECETNEFLSEKDIVEGDAYTYRRYFRQQVQSPKETKDTFMLKSYLNGENEKNGFNPTEVTEDDLKIVTDYIDLNKCEYYNAKALASESDCSKAKNGLCMYQKYGYCPYLFQTQKHCRKIRTLNGEKSNRFNLTQELSKVFEVYPIYYIEHEENGKIVADLITDENGTQYKKMRKQVFYITEKGVENKLGFRYEKNLSDISRTFDSKEIVTKLYVEDVDSELSKTGLCSIKTAEDNPSKDSYIIDFSYYTMRGLLDAAATEADLYGKDENDMGYLKQLGYYNSEYDRLSNLIINLQDESYTELEANVEVNLTGIETAQKELNKIRKNMQKYTKGKLNKTNKTDEKNPDKEEETLMASDTYNNYKIKYDEQRTVLLGLIEDTFMTNGGYDKTLKVEKEGVTINWSEANNVEQLLEKITTYGFKAFKENFLDTHLYKDYGLIGQFTAEYNQIQSWKKERAAFLEKINQISLKFFQKYEPFLKEGTWSDSNYLSDNTYYFGAKEVAKQGAIPKLTYNISVIDLSILDGDYKIGIADSTYIEDIETFGVNQKTGLPNRLKAIISGITYDLDTPTQNSVEIQNYTTQFEDLFQQVSASVQSLSFNENIYKRSSNFTATKNVSGDSLQGGLLENQLTLLETEEKNISLDQTGQSGSDINNHANRYKLNGEGLFFSNNGGQTWNVGVTPKGINADYIKVGALDASKISIVDGNYLYFLWDKTGITAYRSPQATKENGQYFQDFARFNKYGLSLVENGKIKLRAGYNYIGEENAKGEINKEKDLSNEQEIGFFLYNSAGQRIFSTNIAKDEENIEQETARLELAGEIYASSHLIDKAEHSTSGGISYKYSYNDKEKMKQFSNVDIYDLTQELKQGSSNVSSIDYAILEYLWSGRTGETEYIVGSGTTNEFKVKILIQELPQATDIKERTVIYRKTDYTEYYYQQLTVKFKKIYEYSYQIEDGSQTSERSEAEETRTINFYNSKSRYKISNEELKNMAIQTFLGKGTIYLERTKVDNIYVLSQATNGESVSKVMFAKTKVDYYIKNDNKLTKAKDDTEYYFDTVNKIAYPQREEIKETDGGKYITEGFTELYINNKTLEEESSTEVAEVEEQGKRLFCCIRIPSPSEIQGDEDTEDEDTENEENEENDSEEYQGEAQNIFTILKNGELHFGGYIKDIKGNSITEGKKLPSEIKIVDSGIKVAGGTIYMDFEKFKDKNTKQNLMDVINGAVAGASIGRHAHEINKVTLTLDELPDDNVKCSYLPNEETYGIWINKCKSVSALIRTMAGLTPAVNSSEKWTAKSEMATIVPAFGNAITYNATGTMTEFAGSGGGAQTYSYTYTDPVEAESGE